MYSDVCHASAFLCPQLFRDFGNNNNEEKSELSQKEVPVKKSWFSNIFKLEKVENNVTDLNVLVAVQSLDTKNNVGGVSYVSSNLNPSMQEANTHISKGTIDLEKSQISLDKVIRERATVIKFIQNIYSVQIRTNKKVNQRENSIVY
ncbi:hypothetical protein Hanom_Chr05g00431171 [Helianthus anomalus]